MVPSEWMPRLAEKLAVHVERKLHDHPGEMRDWIHQRYPRHGCPHCNDLRVLLEELHEDVADGILPATDIAQIRDSVKAFVAAHR